LATPAPSRCIAGRSHQWPPWTPIWQPAGTASSTPKTTSGTSADFALRTPAPKAAALLRALNGRKHLVTGNNDPAEITALPEWSSVQPYAEITVNSHRLVLCHYAFRTWNGMAKGALNLHGHSHGRLKPLPRQTDVGVDCWDFRPIAVHQMRGSKVGST
jgi:calcineurin-like phosphoesterase family protein